MSEPKSKMPDLKELASITSKLFKDIKTSVGEIIQDYKNVRAQSDVDDSTTKSVKPKETKAEETKTTDEAKPVEKKEK